MRLSDQCHPACCLCTMSDKEAVEMEDKKKVPKGEAKKKKKPASSSKANPKRDTSASEPAAGNPRMSVDSVRYDNDDEERGTCLDAV